MDVDKLLAADDSVDEWEPSADLFRRYWAAWLAIEVFRLCCELASDDFGECLMRLPEFGERMKSSVLLEVPVLLCPVLRGSPLLLVSKGPGESVFNLFMTSSPPRRWGLNGAKTPNESDWLCVVAEFEAGEKSGSEGVVGVLLRDFEMGIGNMGKAPSCDLASGDGGVRGSVALRFKSENGGLASFVVALGNPVRDKFVGLLGAKALGR